MKVDSLQQMISLITIENINSAMEDKIYKLDSSSKPKTMSTQYLLLQDTRHTSIKKGST